MAYSEDALFKAILKNKPPQQPPKPPVAPVQRKDIPRTVPPQVETRAEPVTETRLTPPSPLPKIDMRPVMDSIDLLNSTLNQIHVTIKTIIVPILALILVVAIGILIQSR